MAHAAAAMYGAAAIDGLIEMALPHVPDYSRLPIYVVGALFLVLITVGPRLPYGVICGLGPLGVALVSYALATTNVTASDAAVLYALPVLWQSTFFSRRGALAILVLVGIGDALALVALGRYGYPERWFDVMVASASISVVVVALQERSDRLMASLERQARIDPLTGLLNRRGFDERAGLELAHLRRDPNPYAVVMFDIDHFKTVNDEWGHDAGDRVLAHLARLLSGYARGVDVLARFGGEEFVALLPGTDAAGAEAFAERVRISFATGDAGLPPVRMSAGIAAGNSTVSLADRLRDADRALYEAKRAGRDRSHRFVEPASAAAATPL